MKISFHRYSITNHQIIDKVQHLFCPLFVVFLFMIASLQSARAQRDAASTEERSNREKSLFSIGTGVQHGFILSHSPAVQNTKGAHPTGLELMLSWQRNDAAVWNLCNCYPRKGLLLAYYDYDSKILGKSVSAAYFLEPTYRISNKLFFSFKAAAGLSYLTHPFDSIGNPANQSYSTHLSNYLLVGIGLWVRLHQHWWINTSVNYQHESNGGTRQPNKGINWPTAGFAISYQKSYRPYYSGMKKREKFWKDYSLRLDAGLFGIPRRVLDEHGNSKRLLLIGMVLQSSKQIGRTNALTLGMEVYHDAELRAKLKRDSIKASSVKSGMLIGHEFLLGRFLFNQRLGFYVFDQTPYYDRLYHRWGLQYRINQRLGLGLNLQAYRHVADYVDFRLIYTLRDYK